MNKCYEEIMISQNRYCEDIDLDIICVYNDEKCYRDKLLTSLKIQETSYTVRMLGINNVDGKYTSMSYAYNDIIQYLRGRWVLFLHQDIWFNTRVTLQETINQIDNYLNKYCMWGGYGVVRDSRITISTKQAPMRVDTLDECFFGMSGELLKKLKFNEVLCDNWHMYAVEMCLHNQCLGGENWVVKTDITHLSPGKVTKGYVKTLYKIIDYYKDKGIKVIWTTCAKVNLQGPYQIYILMWLAKHEMLNKVIRPIKNIWRKHE